MKLITFMINNIDRILLKSFEHLTIASTALLISLLVAIPLGIILTRQEKLAPMVLGIANIIMTIPSLALLAFMLPFLGIGNKPAIAALSLYALMPSCAIPIRASPRYPLPHRGGPGNGHDRLSAPLFSGTTHCLICYLGRSKDHLCHPHWLGHHGSLYRWQRPGPAYLVRPH